MRIESPSFSAVIPVVRKTAWVRPPLPMEPPPRCQKRTRPLRILMIAEASGAGTGRHVMDLSDGLLRRGHDIHLIYSNVPGRIDQFFSDRLAGLPRLKTLAMPMRTAPHWSDISVIRRIKQYLDEKGPFDIIHGHSSKGGALARLTAPGSGAAAFYTIHGMTMSDPNHPRWKRVFYTSIELMLSRLTRRIIAVAPEEAREAIRVGFGKPRIVLIPNGVDPVELTPRQTARREMGVEGNEVVIGFVGRLVNQKAPGILVESFAKATRHVPDSVLAIVGGGPLKETLQQLSEKLGVNRAVRLLGERDARGLLAGFDIFAMSSRKEGLPYVLLEAMAAGLPLVTTDRCGIEMLIQPGVNGEVIPMDDVEAFSQSLVHLASDPRRRQDYGAASIELARDLTIDAMVERTVTAYFDGLGEAP